MNITIKGIYLLIGIAIVLVINSGTVIESFSIQLPHQPLHHHHPYSRTSSLLGLTSTSVTSATTTTTTNSSTQLQLDNPIILFDGVCNFCNTWVDILIRLDTKGIYKLTPLQSKLGKSLLQSIGKDADDISSIVLIEKDGKTYYTKSECVLQVVAQLGLPFQIAMKVLKFTVPPFLRDTIYDTVAENRYNILGERDVCRTGDPIYYDRFLSE